jgi:hypothetical protein
MIKRTEFTFVAGNLYSIKELFSHISEGDLVNNSIQHRLGFLNGTGSYEHWSKIPETLHCVILHEICADKSHSIMFSDGSEIKISGEELTKEDINSFIGRVK